MSEHRERRHNKAGVLGRMRSLVDNVAMALDEQLLASWAQIQEYYLPRHHRQRRNDANEQEIARHLEIMLQALAQEMSEQQQQPQPQQQQQPLEFGACVDDLVEIAEVDIPRGVRECIVRFFEQFIRTIPLGLLPESAIRLPLVAIMRQSVQAIEENSPVTGEAHMELAQAVLQLMATFLVHLTTATRSMRLGSELAISSLRAAAAQAAAQAARGHELFILHTIMEHVLAPGQTGQLAREALVLAVRALLAPQDSARFTAFLVEQARVAEVLVEHISYLHAQMPVLRPQQRSPAARVFSSGYSGPRHLPPLERRVSQRLSRHLEATYISVPPSFRLRPYRRPTHEAQPLGAVDAFFVCWELLDEVAAVAWRDERVVGAVQTQLANGFLHTHVAPALLATGASRSQALTTVSYLTDLVSLTHSTHVLDALFAVLLGPELSPEHPPRLPGAQSQPAPQQGLSAEDQQLLDAIEDDALRAEAARLLLPLPSQPIAESGETQGNAATSSADHNASHPVRAALISWLTLDDGSHLSLSTLRLFDAILATMNQFAYTSLVLRNFVDSCPTTDSFYTGPALGIGESAAADQELVRAVVERFVDATPSNIAAAQPDAVREASLRIESAELAPQQQQQEQLRSFLAQREAGGCDDYVHDCLLRLHATARVISVCWQNKAQFIQQQQQQTKEDVDEQLRTLYPGAFVQSLAQQLRMVPMRHMAYNLLLTSILNRLLCIADPALCAYVFLASSKTMPKTNSYSRLLLYDALVEASAEAYVKSQHIPRFSARLARQLREGIETAVRVGAAAHSNEQPITLNPKPAAKPAASMDIDDNTAIGTDPASPPAMEAMSPRSKSKEVAAAAAFLKTPIKRFVNGFIVLNEFGKEMAAMAMALHLQDQDRQLEATAMQSDAKRIDTERDEYADLLEYFDPNEPAFRRAQAVKDLLKPARRSTVINLGPRDSVKQ
ncbi:Retinoic acid induced 16-like protein-domain-containing protein [Coemansia mojavensis]|nr:Retinoic acid induced 16-like protein-domain-containing protein [Coemansia mojavensis]